jgi:hypothetical protein
VLASIEAQWGFEPDAEITMEANPTVRSTCAVRERVSVVYHVVCRECVVGRRTLTSVAQSVEVGKLRDFRRAGINRLSIGVQSLNADDLKYLGRAHSPEVPLPCCVPRIVRVWPCPGTLSTHSPAGSATSNRARERNIPSRVVRPHLRATPQPDRRGVAQGAAGALYYLIYLFIFVENRNHLLYYLFTYLFA